MNNFLLSGQKRFIAISLNELKSMNREEIFSHRKNKFLSIGRKKGFVSKIGAEDNLTMKENFSHKIFYNFKKFKYPTILIICYSTASSTNNPTRLRSYYRAA